MALSIVTAISEERFSEFERALSIVALHFPKKAMLNDKPMLAEPGNTQ
ncbi:hypothetical protein T05_2836 [Trichinella murrelli]|uniref:Uncharacterized protein n=1 Tax=Trichinella murrelli TaxID=144512 RepID=A0A0V0T2C9_9BILA|nr:hypothetical protein T05_2836 [Trichinella murrelli]